MRSSRERWIRRRDLSRGRRGRGGENSRGLGGRGARGDEKEEKTEERHWHRTPVQVGKMAGGVAWGHERYFNRD